MEQAVREYVRSAAGDDAWALGRFVVPAHRLDELQRHIAAGAPRIPLSVLVGPDVADDVARVVVHRERFGARAPVDCMEARAATVDEVHGLGGLLPSDTDRFIEVSPVQEIDALLAAVRGISAGAKIRMGGIVDGAFPAPGEVLRFLRGCRSHGLRFKATAGLHHPVRGEFRLTYAADSPYGTMFGYLNLILAGAFLWSGASDTIVLGVLTERSASAFSFSDARVSWRKVDLSVEAIESARHEFVASIGSCSFREPLEEGKGLLSAQRE